ncbi:hypothetical protein B7463_g11987, partial [Scytalidium lignicola]
MEGLAHHALDQVAYVVDSVGVEKKPQCQRCCDSSRACSYRMKLTWPDEALSRGIAVGRAGTTGKKGGHEYNGSTTKSATPLAQLQTARNLARQPWIVFLNTTSKDVFVHSNQEVPSSFLSRSKEEDANFVYVKSFQRTSTPDSISLSSILASPSAGLGPLNLSQSDSFLFEFYVNRMCSTCALLDTQDNGHRNVIVPISIISPLLLKSVLAVAANHLKFHDSRYRITALQYKGCTLKTLQRLLRNGAVLSFIGQYFASHNIMAYTALAHPTKEREQALLEGGLRWLRTINRPEQEIDCIVGCSTEIMTIILEISQKVRSQKNTMSAQERHQIFLWKVQTERRLTALTQTPLIPPRTISSSLSPVDAQSVSTVLNTAESFRQATLILLQYLCPSFSPISARQSTIQTCVREILDIMSRCPISPIGARSSSLWPFFVAACHVTEDKDRVFVLRRFNEMESRKRFGNIRPVREVVECAWK